MNIYRVHFPPVYPVGCCLVIAAENEEEAWRIARETVAHTKRLEIEHVDTSKPCVVAYLSGDY
jgi:hypothetical protein